MSEDKNQTEVPSTKLPPTKQSKKKLWMILGIIIVIVLLVSTVAVLNFFASNGQLIDGETLSLGFSYSQGEIMDYSTQITSSLTVDGVPQSSSSSTLTAMITQEILSTDENTYTIRTTTQTFSPSAGSSSYTVTMDKSGKIIDYGNLPAETQQMMRSMSTIPGFGSYFPKQTAKVGESWQVPINLQFSGMSFQGTVNYKIVDSGSKTVPAGTYDVISIEISAADLELTISSSTESVVFMTDYDGQIDLEKGTCRMIQLDMNVKMTATIEGETGVIDSSMLMLLEQHTKVK
jgi:hypothetical protein